MIRTEPANLWARIRRALGLSWRHPSECDHAAIRHIQRNNYPGVNEWDWTGPDPDDSFWACRDCDTVLQNAEWPPLPKPLPPHPEPPRGRMLLPRLKPREPWPDPPQVASRGRRVDLGVVELHSNEALRRDFYHVLHDLRESAATVDLWLMDIATILERHGYSLTIYTELKRPAPAWQPSPEPRPRA